MRVYNKFLLFLAIFLSVANIILALLGQNELVIYFIANAIIFFITVLIFRLDRRAMSGLRLVGAFIFIGFLFSVVLKIIEML